MMPRGAISRIALGRDVVPHDLAIDVLLANPAGDQLGVLRAEIQDQDFLVGDTVGTRRFRANGEFVRFTICGMACVLRSRRGAQVK